MRRLFILALMVLFASATCGRAIDTSDKVVREAKQVFAAIRSDPSLLNDRTDLLRCEYSVDWAQYAIPEDLARVELGVKVHLEMVGSSLAAVPGIKELLAMRADDAGAFCTDAEAKTFDDAELAALKAGGQDTKRIDRSAFSFPVFDDHYRKAIVVGWHSSELVIRSGDAIRRLPPVEVTFAIIFKKSKGAWRKVRTEELGIS